MLKKNVETICCKNKTIKLENLHKAWKKPQKSNKRRPYNKAIAPEKNPKVINAGLRLFRTLEWDFDLIYPRAYWPEDAVALEQKGVFIVMKSIQKEQ